MAWIHPTKIEPWHSSRFHNEWDKIKAAERSFPRDVIQCKPGCNCIWL